MTDSFSDGKCTVTSVCPNVGCSSYYLILVFSKKLCTLKNLTVPSIPGSSFWRHNKSIFFNIQSSSCIIMLSGPTSTSNSAHRHILNLLISSVSRVIRIQKPFIFVLGTLQAIGPSKIWYLQLKVTVCSYLPRPEYRLVFLAFLLVSDRNSDVLFISLWYRFYRSCQGLVFNSAADLCSASDINLALM